MTKRKSNWEKKRGPVLRKGGENVALDLAM